MLVCHGCNKEIVGQYIEALGHQWHQEHFVCAVCHKEFAGQKFMERDGKPYCEHDYYEKFGERCFGCGQPIKGEYIEALDHKWHKDHFACTVCGKAFTDGRFLEHDGKPYCDRDYYELFGKRCSICREPLRGEYIIDRWDNPFCARHETELKECFSCRRLICENLTGGGVEYEDGRKICNLCRKTAVDHIDAARPVFAQVLKVLEGLGLRIDAKVEVPLRLADLDEIDRLAGGTPQTEAGISILETLSVNGQEAERKVKEVVILYGLPSTHAAAIMAHEFGHVWCFLNHMPQLPLPVQEGICELFAFRYLSQIDTPESQFYSQGIESNNDPIYGGGFRQVRDAFGKRTFVALLDDVKKRGRL